MLISSKRTDGGFALVCHSQRLEHARSAFEVSNRLAEEQSLYLRQHGENPVDWYPWGEEALGRAKKEEKPLLVSIGYSSCHWCHVMAHESFENDYIAQLMNEHFVCIKVDREERPDIDQIYMEAIQMLTGHGGWPLNVFCLPDGRPFTGGTYFPPDERGRGIVPWPQLLIRVADHFQRNRDQLEENARAIIGNLAASNQPAEISEGPIAPTSFIEAAQTIVGQHDDKFGGFGGAPKFPPSTTLNFLLQLRGSATVDLEKAELAQRIDNVINTTLTAMARGGIYDQIGGGFARYSVDTFWLIPHFEKMLYDNGLLLDIYTKAYLRYREPLYRSIIEETVEWLEREMTSPKRGFYSSLDADSEGVEGKYYVWTPEEVRKILGEENGTRLCRTYQITEEGNFEEGRSNSALAGATIEERENLRPLREIMLSARDLRIPPAKDTKQLTSWNSLAIRGLAEAGFYLNRPDWLEAAKSAADWIWEVMRYDECRLHAVHYDGKTRFNGYLNDYSFYAEALLGLASKVEWIQPGGSEVYVDRARRIIDATLDHFKDRDSTGFFFTSGDHEILASRKIDWWDGAIPSGISSLVHCFSCLYALTADSKYIESLDSLSRSYSALMQRVPSGISYALAGLVSEAIGVVTIKIKGIEDLDPLRKKLSRKPWRRTFLLRSKEPSQPSGYQLCVGTQCLEPTDDVEAVVNRL